MSYLENLLKKLKPLDIIYFRNTLIKMTEIFVSKEWEDTGAMCDTYLLILDETKSIAITKGYYLSYPHFEKSTENKIGMIEDINLLEKKEIMTALFSYKISVDVK